MSLRMLGAANGMPWPPQDSEPFTVAYHQLTVGVLDISKYYLRVKNWSSAGGPSVTAGSVTQNVGSGPMTPVGNPTQELDFIEARSPLTFIGARVGLLLFNDTIEPGLVYAAYKQVGNAFTLPVEVSGVLDATQPIEEVDPGDTPASVHLEFTTQPLGTTTGTFNVNFAGHTIPVNYFAQGFNGGTFSVSGITITPCEWWPWPSIYDGLPNIDSVTGAVLPGRTIWS